jgi:plasmid stabilization system protein ParE
MTYRVILQPRAEREIREAARWIFDQSKSEKTTLRWARSIRAKIETLRKHPTRCPIDPDSVVYGEQVRVLLAGKRHGVYRVLFAIRGDAVHVLTVRHSSQRRLSDELEEGD